MLEKCTVGTTVLGAIIILDDFLCKDAVYLGEKEGVAQVDDLYPLNDSIQCEFMIKVGGIIASKWRFLLRRASL